MRIVQYFLMTDYSLWEVILNGDSPTPTRIVDGVVQSIAPTTAEQRFAKKNKLKARGTLLIALPDMHQLKFNIHKDAKTLMEAIEKRFGGNKETKKIYGSEVKGSSASSQNTLNIAFVSSNNTDSTNESVSAVPTVSDASSKPPVSTLPNVDSLKEMDLKWQMAMLTMRARRFIQRTGRNLGANETAAIGFDMSKVECYNFQRKGHFARKCRSPRDNRNKEAPRRTVPVEVSTSNALVSQCDAVGGYDRSFQADEEPTNYALRAYSSSGSSSSSGSDNEIQVFDKTGLGYDSQVFDRQVFDRQVFDCEEFHSDESVNSVPTSLVNDRYMIGEGYHVVPPPYTRTFMPLKPDLVFNDAHTASESIANVTSDSEDEYKIESVPKQNEPSFVSIFEHVKTPRESVKKVEHPKQAKNIRIDNQKSRGHKNNWNRKAYFVCRSLHHLIKDCDYYEKQMVLKPVWNSAMRVNHQNSVRMTHPHLNRNVVPTTVLTRSRLVSFNAARPVATAVSQTTVKSPRPVKHVVNKAHLPIRRPINHRPATKNSNFNKKVTTVKVNRVNDVQGVKGNANKALANWTLKKSIEDMLHLVGIQKMVRLQAKESLMGRPMKDFWLDTLSIASTNRVNAASAPVAAAGPNLTNNTNSFNTASPSDTAVSLNFRIAGKSLFVDPTNYPDDPDMPALEDIVYSDDEEDVGAEADFSNLKTNISASPIPTTRVHKDHPVTQILDDLTSAPQTRSMARMVKEQGLEDPDYPDKVYKVVKALYGLHQAPRAWKFGFTDVKLASTPIEIEKPLLKDPDGEDVDVHIYRYLKGKPHLGLWYPKDSPFNLVSYSDSDYDGASLDKKSTTGDGIGVTVGDLKLLLLGIFLTVFWASATIKKVNDVVQLRSLIERKKVVVIEDVIRQDLRLDDADGVECLPNEEIFTELARMGYEKPPPNAKRTAWIEFSYSMASTVICLATEPHDAEEEDEIPTAPTPPSSTNAPSPVPPDPIPTPLQAQPATPKLHHHRNNQLPPLRGCIQTRGKIEAIDANEDITLVDEETQEEVADMNAELQGRINDVSAATKDANATEPTMFDDEEVTMTMAQTLIKMKAEKAKLLDEQVAKRLHDQEVKQAAVKYPIIDWEIHSEGSRTYWKIIRVVRITEAYQSFEDMLKGFDREDLVAL
nr:hypothetical protein [Tanacetum cinerariifolium]